ncbi:MAG: phosphoribulokinase [Gammaproteobacteria bacterium]|nr:phosphoribulokinase [Gammaproteobacteria bacterium]
MSFSKSLKKMLQQEIQRRSLPDDFMLTVRRWYLPVAEQISQAKRKSQESLLVSFNGSQGSGKSTITAFLRLILIHHFELNTVEVSIDDFYLTRQSRLQLASDVHPLFETRGVPGTHDVKLITETFNCLQHCSPRYPCVVPQFDKASDDRKPQSEWPVIKDPVDIILFEGWCNHAPVESAQQLELAINDLERDEDSEGRWRSYSNQQLAEYHRLFFDQADMLIYLKVPSFEKVYEWRGLQEQKLAKQNKREKNAVMDERQLHRFIQHYERITRSCLKKLPASADIVLYLNGNHAIESIKIKGSRLYDA